jgi:hypothetical protein
VPIDARAPTAAPSGRSTGARGYHDAQYAGARREAVEAPGRYMAEVEQIVVTPA